MKKTLLAIAIAGLLTSCVEVPVEGNNAPTVELQIDSVKAFPGSTFQVNFVLNDDTTKAADLKVNWSFSDVNISVLEQAEDHAVFFVGIGVDSSKEAIITAKVSDGDGKVTEQSVSIDIEEEPYIILDAETDENQTQNSMPIYLTGVYSAKRINLKENDALYSKNLLIDVSPDSRYVFYVQLFNNLTWRANLYDTQTGLKTEINIDFKDVDLNTIQSFWSNDSKYLAIQVPHSGSNTAKDKLYWFDVSSVSSNGVDLKSQSASFDHLTWSDNSSSEQAYASLSTASSISVLNPSIPVDSETSEDSQSPITKLTLEGGPGFSRITVGSEHWASNQLFFIASTTVLTGTTTTHENTLFSYISADGYVKQINGSAGSKDINRFKAYVATQVVYQEAVTNTLYFYDGISESQITLNGISQLTNIQTNFGWSPEGTLLGISATATNAGDNNGFHRLSMWADNDNTKVPLSSTIDAEAEGYTGYNIAAWNWTTNKDRVAILSHGEEANKLLIGETNNNDSVVEVVQSISHDSTADAKGDELLRYLVASPSGKWQLYWGVDTNAESKHLDLWAYNVESGEAKNVSDLASPYLKPDEVGQFSLTETGFSNEENDEVYYVSENISWENDSLLVFDVRDFKEKEIRDIRAVDLSSTDEVAHSILLKPDEISKIKGHLD